MSWMSQTGKLFVYGLAGLGASAFAYTGYNTYTDRSKTRSPRVSNIWPLGNVSASWTTSTHYNPSVVWDHNWDRRDPKSMVKPCKNSGDTTERDKENELKKVQPKATRHLLLIRHGHYKMDAETDVGRILTALGREQADYTGARLKELNKPYTKLINSSMTRAKETADIIAKHMPDVPRESCDLLQEGAPIPPEPPSAYWQPEAHEFHEEGARIEAAFRKYVHRADPSQTEDSYEVIVCHGNVIRYFVCRGLQFPPEGWLRISLDHGSITWLTIRPSGRVSIRTMGDSGHIPAEKISVWTTRDISWA